MPVRRGERNPAVKLFGFRRADQRGRGRIAAGNHLGDLIEITSPDEALVRRGAVADLLRGELFLLKLRVSCHACLPIATRQMEHGHIQGVEAGQRHELELVAHLAKLLLEVGYGHVVELFLPVE